MAILAINNNLYIDRIPQQYLQDRGDEEKEKQSIWEKT